MVPYWIRIDIWQGFVIIHEWSWNFTTLIRTIFPGCSWFLITLWHVFHVFWRSKISVTRNWKTMIWMCNRLHHLCVAYIYFSKTKLSEKFAIIREWSSNPVRHQFQFTRTQSLKGTLFSHLLISFCDKTTRVCKEDLSYKDWQVSITWVAN